VPLALLRTWRKITMVTQRRALGLTVTAGSLCTALLVLSSSPLPRGVRGLVVAGATAGIGALVTACGRGTYAHRLLRSVLIVEGVFVALNVWWLASVLWSYGHVPVRIEMVAPFIALIALHHGGLALGGSLTVALIQTAGRVFRGRRA
jgi:hypothetical protein